MLPVKFNVLEKHFCLSHLSCGLVCFFFGIPHCALSAIAVAFSIMSDTGTFSALAIFPTVLGEGERLPEKYLLMDTREISADSARSPLFMQAFAIAICNFWKSTFKIFTSHSSIDNKHSLVILF